MHSKFMHLAPYNRPTLSSIHHAASSNGWSALFLSGNTSCIIAWLILIIAIFLIIKGISKPKYHRPRTHLDIILQHCRPAMICIGIGLLISIGGLNISRTHRLENQYLASPRLSTYCGTYRPDKQRVAFGLDRIKITPHDLYGYYHNRTVIDFHFSHAEYYHPLLLDANHKTVDYGPNSHAQSKKVSYTVRRSPSVDNGILLIGHYQTDIDNFADQFNNDGLLKAHQTYGMPHHYYRAYNDDLKSINYPVTNADHRFVLPRPKTTMVVGFDNGTIVVNPLGARQINDYSGFASTIKKHNSFHENPRIYDNAEFNKIK